jgi:hypothetical protein
MEQIADLLFWYLLFSLILYSFCSSFWSDHA